MIKAVIFDLDGTLLDTLSTIAYYCNRTLEYCGLEPIEEEKFKYFAGDGKKMLIHRALGYRNSDNPNMFKKAEENYDREYEGNVIGKTKPFDNILELLQDLRKNGLKIAILSNKPDNVTVMLSELMFAGLIDITHGKMEGIEVKPNPEGALMTARELGVAPEECVFVGDTNVDIKTAKNAGMKSIGVLWGFRDEKELKEAGADYIVSSPEDIIDAILKMENEKTRENKR